MEALFIHDHKFPRKETKYYYSYGFDEEFFNRYLEIFDELSVIGRETECQEKNANENTVSVEVDFYTFKNYKCLLEQQVKNKIDTKILNSEFIIVRLPSITGIYALKKVRKYNKPYIIEVVGHAWDSLWNQKFPGKLLAPVMTIMVRNEIRRASHVIYVTNEFLQKKYPTTANSISCSNVTLKEVLDYKLKERIDKINKTSIETTIILGTCASLTYYKGQQNVIEAMSELKVHGFKIQYQLVGGGESTYLEEVARKNNVSNDVVFIGQLPHHEVFEWLDSLDIYIQPSLTEGLPRSVIEAMSRACPIIASNAGGITELINNNCLFSKGDSKSIVRIIAGLTKENMKSMAKDNHEKSKEYLKKILYERRKDFFNTFINSRCKN